MGIKAKWLDDPEPHDYPAAEVFATLLWGVGLAARARRALERSRPFVFRVNDLLRASGLPLLEADDPHVLKDLRKVQAHERLSPVLLAALPNAGRLVILDGYHRVCALCHLDEDAEVPARLCALHITPYGAVDTYFPEEDGK